MYQNKRAAFYTLGCKLNFSETSTISRQLKSKGFIITDFDRVADLYVINTCSVTENANKNCRRIIRKAKEKSPNALIIVTGCYAQLKPKEITKIEGVDMVLGANDKFNIPNLLNNLNKKNKAEIHGCEIENLEYNSAYSLNDRTRSFLKIQDGCNYTCSYCTIPFARGKNRSDSIENIVANAKKIVNQGIKEIVITGVNIGTYDNKNKTFTNLIKELDKVKGVERYRISSIEPNLITDEMIDVVKNSKKFMPHFHIPLQSGSDLILGKMRRRYKTKLYLEKINNISKKIENVCIGADVIVGFPGETDEEFNKTLDFIRKLNLSYLHVFSYSERENTQAINLEGKVSKQVKSLRSKQLRILSEKLQRKFYEKNLNGNFKVLFENHNKDGMMFGFTENYIKVKTKYNHEICQTIKSVSLFNIENDGLMTAKFI
ncbi:MAG: tRNA (N(6)-L-threonylcarbamoyladenosine(37)-C(2))-methylthiotransferase MtaB [Flavobacteriales bacterium]|nr:tRNA (N(6)-L-threonylcarbamoyladenosine(37)-C(2))-methylthiotransferase MtaB [Flavobacteriales bacterium]|tara:strand:- start:581 stop:1873 length:1293 start_codon:yes stop_codon:yes gene_type:complete